MAQADAARNYYADLGVPAGADENGIRKAFRQLALKYHPDRNPGRETEFVAKFQQIQTAHEILSDPTRRAKYDQERRRYRGLNIPSIPPYNPNNPSTPRNRPPPPPRPSNTYTTPKGPYYHAPPPKPTPQRPPPPQHTHTTYANGADRFTSRNFRAPPTAQQPNSRAKDAEARANVFTAWQKMKQPRAEEPRPQNPNPNPNANRNPNNPNGIPFGRSKSTRVPSKKGFDPLTPGGDEGQARSSYRSNYERPMPSPPHADPLKHFKEQMEEQDVPHVPYAEGTRVRTPYVSTAATGERTSMFGENLGRSSSVRNSPTHRPSSSADAGSFSDSGRRQGQRNSYHGPNVNPFPHMYVSSSDDESPPPQKAPPPRQAHFGASPANGPDAPPSPFKSRSHESINMKFSPSDWHGKFEGKSDYFAPAHAQKGASAKDRISPVRGRPSQRPTAQRAQSSGQYQQTPPISPFVMPQSSQMPPPPMPPPPPGPPPLNTQSTYPTGTASAPHSAKFNQHAWADTFKEPSFILPQTTKETSPRRGSVASKRSKPVTRKNSVAANGMKASSDTLSENSRPKYQTFAEDASTGDSDAMDIDSGTPPVERPNPSATAEDKTYKQGTPIKFNTPSKTAPSSPLDQGPKSMTPNGSATAPSSATEARSSSGLSGLDGLKNVEPFIPSANGGLSGMGDLGDTLPFKSKASNAHPTKPNYAQKLRVPPVPSPPQPPATLNETSVLGYLKFMESYVNSFRDFNRTMTKHFLSREAEFETSLDENFIRNRGETTKGLGFSSYVRKMKEDQALMESWKLAQEMHLKALQACEEVRNKTVRSHAEG